MKTYAAKEDFIVGILANGSLVDLENTTVPLPWREYSLVNESLLGGYAGYSDDIRM